MDSIDERTVSLSDFGDQLRRWRRRADLSQTQVAARVGYHHSVISKLESGSRKPSSQLARRLDEVLETGGGLSQTLAATDRPRWDLADRMDVMGPNEGGLAPAQVIDVDMWDATGWPARLPSHGLPCPLHAAAGCEVPPAEEAFALYAAFSDGSREVAGTDLVHVLTALLASYTRTAEEQTTPGVVTAVEIALRALMRALHPASGKPPRALFQLAAAYAVLAGEQRMVRGQQGAAMAWYSKGLHWAVLADDMNIRVTVLCNMSTLSRLELDGQNALVYANALQPLEHDRRWVSTLAYLYRARGCALLGDHAATARNVDLARDLLARLDQRDSEEAPWLCGTYGQVLVESGAGAALRDVAAATANHTVAQAAIRASEHTLRHLPRQMRPFRALMRLRLADSYACAGEPEVAVAVALPVVTDVEIAPTACIRQEMRGLRSRLLARSWEQPMVREFVERTHGYAA